MATLKKAHKVFVVQRLACYDRPKEVADALKEAFGVEATVQQIAYYDPTRTAGGTPGKRWVELFRETRETFKEDTSGLAIAQKTWRLKNLEEGARDFKEMGNYVGMADLLEQAAKEMGGAYTNERRHQHDVKAQLGFTADERAQAEEELEDWAPEDDE